MNKIERTTNILANLVTVIEKRGDYNLDEYSNKIAALYSSQEPQKSEKQKVADLLGVPLSEVHTLDIQDGKLVEIVDKSQSVSTSTEGMELSELSPQEIAQAKRDSIKGQIVQTDMVTIGARAQLKKDQAQVAKVLSNLPTEQGAELNNKLREQFATLIWHYWEQTFAYPKSAHLYGCVDELFKLLKSLPTSSQKDAEIAELTRKGELLCCQNGSILIENHDLRAKIKKLEFLLIGMSRLLMMSNCKPSKTFWRVSK